MGVNVIEKFYLFFHGIMLFQVVFFAAIYFIHYRKDVLYYSLLNLFASLYFTLNAPNVIMGIPENDVFNHPYYLYVNFGLLMGMVYTYLIFLHEIFKDDFQENSYLNVAYLINKIAIVSLFILFCIANFFEWPTQPIFYFGHFVNGPLITFIIIKNLKAKSFKGLIVKGMMVIFICFAITMYMTIIYNSNNKQSYIYDYPLLWIKIGMLIDIVFFQLALLIRWYEQEKELVSAELQSQKTLMKLKNEISSDLHDDIGTRLSKINLQAYLLNLRNSQIECKPLIESIQKEIQQSTLQLKDIVWAVDIESDKINDLFDRILEYAHDVSNPLNISIINHATDKGVFHFKSISKKYQLYLISKEIINNAVKHSLCTEITLSLINKENHYWFEIADNGIGFDSNIDRKGFGITNIVKRAKAIECELMMTSVKGEGTRYAIELSSF